MRVTSCTSWLSSCCTWPLTVCASSPRAWDTAVFWSASAVCWASDSAASRSSLVSASCVERGEHLRDEGHVGAHTGARRAEALEVGPKGCDGGVDDGGRGELGRALTCSRARCRSFGERLEHLVGPIAVVQRLEGPGQRSRQRVAGTLTS